MNRQLESMTRCETGWFTVRVWRTEDKLTNIDNRDIENLAFSLWNSYRHKPPLGEIAAAFETLPRVAAVEVLDIGGNGVLIYPDWK